MEAVRMFGYSVHECPDKPAPIFFVERNIPWNIVIIILFLPQVSTHYPLFKWFCVVFDPDNYKSGHRIKTTHLVQLNALLVC